jgi:hypothetical protein
MSASLRWASALLVSSLLGGCAVFKPPPEELNLRGSVVAPVATHPIPVLNGSGPRPTIGKGAAVGAGVGVAALPLSIPLCAAAGPAAGFCILAVVPAAAGVGAGSGAVVAKANGEPRESTLARRDMVLAEVMAADSENLLAAQVRQSLQTRQGAAWQSPDAAEASPWRVEVAVANVAMYGALDEPDFALRVRCKLLLKRTSDDRIVYRADMAAMSDDQVAPVTPDADPNVLIRSRLERGVQLVSEKLVTRLLSRTDTSSDADAETEASADLPATLPVALTTH